MDKEDVIREFLRGIGRLGGQVRSKKKAAASRRNGRKATSARVLAALRKRKQLSLNLGYERKDPSAAETARGSENPGKRRLPRCKQSTAIRRK